MKSALSKPIHLTAVLVLTCAIGASANVHLTFSSVNAGYVMGGVYTSPYKILVDGTPTLLICDDFLTDPPTTGGGGDAEETSLADLLAGTNPAGTPKFTPVSIKNYVAAAVL